MVGICDIKGRPCATSVIAKVANTFYDVPPKKDLSGKTEVQCMMWNNPNSSLLRE
jgi:hypothetical protein